MTYHHIFRTSPPTGTDAAAWGSRHRMALAGDADPLCDVRERLKQETILQDLILQTTCNRPAQP